MGQGSTMRWALFRYTALLGTRAWDTAGSLVLQCIPSILQGGSCGYYLGQLASEGGLNWIPVGDAIRISLQVLCAAM